MRRGHPGKDSPETGLRRPRFSFKTTNEARASPVETGVERSARVALGIVVGGVVLGVWADVLFRGQETGLNVLLWAIAFTGVLAVLLRLARAPWQQGRRWMLAPMLLFSASFLWRASTLLTAVNLLALAGAVTIGALRRTRQGQRAAVGDYAAGALAAGCAAAAGAIRLLQAEVEWERSIRGLRNDRARAIGRGLGLGLPLLALFGGLFMAADAVFKNLLTSAVPNLDHPLEHVLIVLGTAWLSAGLLRDLLAAREEERIVSPAALARTRATLTLGATELAVALGILNALFLAFVLVQFRYLFGGHGLVESRAHLTYAQYARHGFFELVVVSILVLLVLLAADASLRGNRNRGALLVRALSGLLVALVFVVMVSALQRMRLYEQAYGLTQLRVYAVGVIGWLGVVFAWFAATVLRGRRSIFPVGAVVAGFLATAVLNVVNPDALIARTNLERSRVDVAYVGGLSDDAVPAILDKLPTLRPDTRRALALALLGRSSDEGDWRSLNVARSQADRLLAEHHDELLEFSR
jgi:Domain of unknown function (DUF4173)